MVAEAAADRRLNIYLGIPLHYNVEDSSSTDGDIAEATSERWIIVSSCAKKIAR